MGCAFCVLVWWCAVLCRHVWCWCAMCGVWRLWCLWCVCVVCDVCVRCGVCAVWCLWCLCVWRGLARGKHPVCRFQTPPCVRSKRFRVYQQNARMLNTCARFASTHGGVLNVHTERREEGGEGVLFSLFLSSLFSLSFPSLSFSPLYLFSLPSLVFSPSLLATMTMITRPIGSLCVHTALLCPECRSACTFAHSLFGEHVRITQETTVLA